MKIRYAKAAVLGIIAGMRSMSAPALVSIELSKSKPSARDSTLVHFFKTGATPLILRGLAVGEFLGDKLPSVPDRIKPAPLIARTLSGAVSGAAICSQDDDCNVALGAALGAAAAIGSSFFFYYLRRAAVKRLKTPDTTVALVEDGLVAAAGRFITR